MLNERNKVERLKEMYPKGTRIRLAAMSGEPDMPPGLMGTVDFEKVPEKIADLLNVCCPDQPQLKME